MSAVLTNGLTAQELNRLSGLLLVDKEAGITSHDVVDRFRRHTRIKKTGHTGTLDPFATGLLVLCVGNTTRLQSYLTGIEKTYEGVIQFGWATSTYDPTGETVGEQREVEVDPVALEAAKEKFTGEIDQMPPAFSAKKINGVRAYELARKGETPELTAKRVNVFEFSLLEISGSRVTFRARCSAGTYVRSLAHDLGAAIGVPAHLASLRRTAIGSYRVEDAVPSQRMRDLAVGELLARPQFRDIDSIDLPFPSVSIDPLQERKLLQGQTIIVMPDEPIVKDQMVAVSTLPGELIAIGVAVDVLRENGGPVAIQPKVVLKTT